MVILFFPNKATNEEQAKISKTALSSDTNKKHWRNNNVIGDGFTNGVWSCIKNFSHTNKPSADSAYRLSKVF